MTEPQPLPFGRAMSALGRCFAATARLLGRGAVHLPRANVGRRPTVARRSSTARLRSTSTR
jgi:hypothetical protein